MPSPLGTLEELVLLAICGLVEEAYAVTIQQQLVSAADRNVTMGAVYATLDRLEKKGFVRSKLGAVTHERGGRRKRFYEISGPGTRALSRALNARQQLTELVPSHLRPELGLT